MNNKKFEEDSLTFPLMGLVVLIGLAIFLFVGDGGKTGWQILGLQGVSFWLFAIAGVIIAGYLAWRLYLGELNATFSTGKKIIYLALILILLISPWGRACTDKANQGVTAPGYKPSAP